MYIEAREDAENAHLPTFRPSLAFGPSCPVGTPVDPPSEGRGMVSAAARRETCQLRCSVIRMKTSSRGTLPLQLASTRSSVIIAYLLYRRAALSGSRRGPVQLPNVTCIRLALLCAPSAG